MFFEAFAVFRVILCVLAEIEAEFTVKSDMFLDIFPAFLLILYYAAEIVAEFT